MASKKKKQVLFTVFEVWEKIFFHMLNDDYEIQKGRITTWVVPAMDGLLCFKAVGEQ